MIKHETRKTLKFYPSGRSTDYICPPFVRGCKSGCYYCYVKRHIKTDDLFVANNIEDILKAVDNHLATLGEKIPSQTDPKFWTYDIGCQSDFSIDANYIDWELILKHFKTINAKASFATKTVNLKLLKFNPDKKTRIRMTLNPELGLEPFTSPVIKRIKAIDQFYDVGYETHINLSPIVIKPNMQEDYLKLFKDINENVRSDVKKELKIEAIFLTHNEDLHNYNLTQGHIKEESLLWVPEIQELKTSKIPNEDNVRYQHLLKERAVNWFKELVKKELDIEIRYIF